MAFFILIYLRKVYLRRPTVSTSENSSTTETDTTSIISYETANASTLLEMVESNIDDDVELVSLDDLPTYDEATKYTQNVNSLEHF